MVGGKFEGSGSVFWKALWKLFVVTLEHGTCLCLVLQLGNFLVSESYQSYESLYSFPTRRVPQLSSHYVLVYISSSQCFQVICHASQCSREVSSQINHSAVLPTFILVSVCAHLIYYLTSLSCVSFVSMMGDTSWPSFDESVPVDFNTLSGIRLRNQLVPWNLHAPMVGLLTFDSRFTSLASDRMIP
jgi:hypothetical protein